MTTSAPLPDKGRLAGIDYGTVRIGVAICDEMRMLASPLETYTRRDLDADEQFFRQLAKEESLVGFVVGLPIHGSGSESQKSQEARAFADWLTKVTELPVALVDERFTTAQAEQALLESNLTSRKRKARVDKIAAQIILSTYLDAPHQSVANTPLEDD